MQAINVFTETLHMTWYNVKTDKLSYFSFLKLVYTKGQILITIKKQKLGTKFNSLLHKYGFYLLKQ